MSTLRLKQQSVRCVSFGSLTLFETCRRSFDSRRTYFASACIRGANLIHALRLLATFAMFERGSDGTLIGVVML
jgi:hypothetical protein